MQPKVDSGSSSPMSLNVPRGDSRTPTRSGPQTSHTASTTSRSSRARFSIGPPYDLAPVGAGIDELVEQVAVGGVNLDALEARLESILGPAHVLSDEVGHLLDLQGPRRHERSQFPLAFFVLDQRLPLGWMAEGATGSIPSGCSEGARCADMPELQEDQAAGLVYRVGDQPPALDLLAAVNARRPGVALSLHRDLGCLANDEGGRGPLGIIAGVESGRHVARLAGPRPGQRRHDDPVRQEIGPHPDWLKQPFPGVFCWATTSEIPLPDTVMTSFLRGAKLRTSSIIEASLNDQVPRAQFVLGTDQRSVDEMFHQKPSLQLAGVDDLRYDQVVRTVVAVFSNLRRCVVGFSEDRAKVRSESRTPSRTAGSPNRAGATRALCSTSDGSRQTWLSRPACREFSPISFLLLDVYSVGKTRGRGPSGKV